MKASVDNAKDESGMSDLVRDTRVRAQQSAPVVGIVGDLLVRDVCGEDIVWNQAKVKRCRKDHVTGL